MNKRPLQSKKKNSWPRDSGGSKEKARIRKGDRRKVVKYKEAIQEMMTNKQENGI